MHPQVLLHGSTERRVDPVILRAGSLTLHYEAGFLRYLKVGETEVLRMINYYIRDENWANIPMTVVDEQIEQSPNGFRINYRSECISGDIKYHWVCAIRGSEDNITFEIAGESDSSFKRNRLGFTVLHPIRTCAGKHCTITHSNKRQEILKFPELINPHQPFVDIVEMRWNPSDSIEAFLQFEGDIFETEDQRNWSDASYKTYCTPLSRPFPVDVKPGDKVKQTVRLNVAANKAAVADRKHPLTFSLERQGSTSFPHIGLSWNNLALDATITQRISSLRVDFLRMVVDPTHPELFKTLNRGLQLAQYLELVLFVEDKIDMGFVDKILPITDHIKQIVLLPSKGKSTTSQLIHDCVPVLRKSFPKARIGGGTDGFFTELNRERTPTGDIDFVTFSLNPQCHASDNATMIENLEAQKDIVQSCRAFTGNKAIHVGPVTFKMRWNPAATSKEKPNPNAPDPSVDQRHLSMIGAAWMLGSFKYLAENNVASISFFETSGRKGLIPHPDEPWPETLMDKEDLVYPLYIILKQLLAHRPKRVIKFVSNYPLVVDGLALTEPDGRLFVYLMNFTGDDQLLTIPPDSRLRRTAIIDDYIMNKWIKDPEGQFLVFKETVTTVLLPPYSVAVLKQ